MRCTGPCSASVGAYKKMAAAASSMSATAPAAMSSYRDLVIEHEARRERGEHDEKYVEVDQQPQRLVRRAGPAHRHLDRLTARDHERDPQRDREQRQQELARAELRDHGREYATERRDHLARTPLGQQVLAGDRHGDPDRCHWTMRSREPTPSTRPLRSTRVR